MLSLGLGSDGDRGGKRRRGREGADGRGNTSLVEAFPFIVPPDPRAIADGWRQLCELGAGDDRRRHTPTGRTQGKLPVDVPNRKSVVYGKSGSGGEEAGGRRR